MSQLTIGETHLDSQSEARKRVNISMRIYADWIDKIAAIAAQTGRTRTDIVNEAIAQYLQESIPSVLNDIAELRLALADVLEKNYLVERQNQNLHKRLQMLERKFKSLAS